MSISHTYGRFELISNAIGGEAALKVCSFFGGRRSVRIPTDPATECTLSRLIGPAAFAKLVDAFGGDVLNVPNIDTDPLKTAGKIFILRTSGLSTREMGALLDLSHSRIAVVLDNLKREGFNALASELEDAPQITPADFADAVMKSAEKIAMRMAETVDPTIENILKSAGEYLAVADTCITTEPSTAMNSIVLAESAIQLADRLFAGDPAAVALAAPWMPKGAA